eukprot:UN12943
MTSYDFYKMFLDAFEKKSFMNNGCLETLKIQNFRADLFKNT